MSKNKAKFSLIKTASLGGKFKAAHAAGPVVDFQLGDNGDATFTIFGVDAAGNGGIDLKDVATLEVTSDNPTVLTVDDPVAPKNTTSAMHAVGPLGSANLACDITMNDGASGPFGCDIAVTTKQGPTTGVVPQIDSVTSH